MRRQIVAYGGVEVVGGAVVERPLAADHLGQVSRIGLAAA